MPRRDRWLCALLLAGLLVGCVTDHEALEKKPDVAHSGGSAGLGTAGSLTQFGGAGGNAADGGGHSDDEPPGKSLLTIVNGVVDAPSVLLCWAKIDAEGGVSALGQPLTDKPFEYAQNLVLTAVAGAKLDTDTLEPLVIAGDLELVSGLDCADAVARAEDEEVAAIAANARAKAEAEAGSGGYADAGDAASDGGAAGAGPDRVRSRLRLRGLPAIPAGTLSAGRSILLVATGCMGGATYQAAKAEEYCGAGYSEQAPTLSAVLVSLSRRVDSAHVGMQFVHASRATSQVAVSSQPPFPSQSAGPLIAVNVGEGQASPHSALLTYSAFDYGSARLYSVQIAAQGNALSSDSWQEVLARGGVSALENGTTYALVLLGPRADHALATPLWNPALVTIIPVESP